MPRRLIPSLSDFLFVSLVALLFMSGSGWTALLADGDAGWHIRTGEYILEHRHLPAGDPFSFTKQGEQWYAWEWLSDVAFAAMHRWFGLKGVVWLAGVAIAAALTVLFRQLLWRGVDLWIALAACLLSASASMVHFLARPHVFTLLLFVISLFLLDADRRKPGPRVWLLVPIAAMWANLHGGFLALLAMLALMAATAATAARRRREISLLAACAAATLLNPYGIGLHRHIAAYLNSQWIRDAIQEFQSPRFRGENMVQFEVLLFAGLIAVAALAAKREWTGALITLFWAHAALGSVRHVPMYALAAAPWWAGEAGERWRKWAAGRAPGSVAKILQNAGAEYAAAGRRTSAWPAVLALALLLPGAPGTWPEDFPREKFPAALVARQAEVLDRARVFTSDQWAGYLIYRFYPRQRVFVDGRSDFYGPGLGKQYLRMTRGEPGAEAALEGYGIRLVLAPPEWALAGVLKQTGRWRVLDQDKQAVLLFAEGVNSTLQLGAAPTP